MVAIRQWRWVSLLVLSGLVMQALGCGTIFWPERKGQPAGRLDPKVVALDAIGMILFIVPGVIAFALDFNNGTIYLPPDQQSRNTPTESGWIKASMSSKSPTPTEIEHIVLEKTGKKIRLQSGLYRAVQLNSPAELASLKLDEVSLATIGTTADVCFRAQSD